MSAGSVKRRGESWRARYRGDDGKDRQRTFARKSEAHVWVRAQLSALASGTHVDPSAGTVRFADFASEWLGSLQVRERTSKLHEGRLRLYINPILGDLPLRSIRRSHVTAVITAMVESGLSALVVRFTLTTMRSILSAAVADRLIATNVAADRSIQLPKRERATGTLSPEQVAQIAERMTPRLRAMVVVGASTGLRPAELSALTLDRCRGLASLLSDGRVTEISPVATGTVVLRVDRQLTPRRSFGPVKTSSSNREVAIPATVAAVLVEHLNEFGLGADDLVFSTPTGRPLGSPNLSTAWAKAAEGLRLPEGSWHLLRHHHASQLLSAGVNVAMVARRLGHSSPTITLSTYAHVMPDDDARALAISEQIAARLA